MSVLLLWVTFLKLLQEVYVSEVRVYVSEVRFKQEVKHAIWYHLGS